MEDEERQSVTLINLTGHDLTITVGNRSIHLQAHQRAARINSDVREVGSIEAEGMSIPILRLQEREVLNLPEPQDGVIYIVSGIVATAAQRADVLAPSRVSRESGSGKILECKALILPSPIRRVENGKSLR